MVFFVITPFWMALIFPSHGNLCFTQGGCFRPGGGELFLKKPPKDCDED